MTGVAHRVSYTGNNEWYTPKEYTDLARKVMGNLDVDPASNVEAQEWIKATKFYTSENDGLVQHWIGSVWLNPPYSQPLMNTFVDKLLTEITAKHTTQAIVLVNNSTDTIWFHRLSKKSDAMCFTRGRIKFTSPGKNKYSPTQGQVFFYFGQNVSEFFRLFSDIGVVMKLFCPR